MRSRHAVYHEREFLRKAGETVRNQYGIIVPEKKQNYKNLVAAYIAKEHIDSVILGCTELPLMIQEGDLPVPILNTSQIHIEKIITAALL